MALSTFDAFKRLEAADAIPLEGEWHGLPREARHRIPAVRSFPWPVDTALEPLMRERHVVFDFRLPQACLSSEGFQRIH